MAVRMVLPPGFRFHPTDEELIAFYLYRKSAGMELHSNVIADVDLYRNDPWDLPNFSCISSRDSEAWYFFHGSDRKYPKGSRTNRATPSGYWKATGRDRNIYSTNPKSLLGFKKTLVFYRGRAPSGQRTDWVMHEYQLSPSSYPTSNNISHGGLVVCRVVKKKSKRPSLCSSDGTENFINHSNTMPTPASSDAQRLPCDTRSLPTISLYAQMVDTADQSYDVHCSSAITRAPDVNLPEATNTAENEDTSATANGDSDAAEYNDFTEYEEENDDPNVDASAESEDDYGPSA